MAPFVVDNTILKSTQCSLQAWMKHIQGRTLKVDRAELNSGRAIHLALEEHWRGKTPDECMRVFAGEYEEWACEHVDPESKHSWENYSTIFRYWLETHPIEQLPFQPIRELIEAPVQFPLDEHGDFLFIVNLDLIARYQGGLVAVETKTTGRIDDKWSQKWHIDSQLSGQVYGAMYGTFIPTGQPVSEVVERLTGKTVFGAFVNAMEFPKLPQDSTRKCRTHALPYQECRLMHAHSAFLGELIRTPEQLEKWRWDALRLAKRLQRLQEEYPSFMQLQEVPQEGEFYNACQWCEYMNLCQGVMDPTILEGRLLKAKWDPRERRVVEG